MGLHISISGKRCIQAEQKMGLRSIPAAIWNQTQFCICVPTQINIRILRWSRKKQLRVFGDTFCGYRCLMKYNHHSLSEALHQSDHVSQLQKTWLQKYIWHIYHPPMPQHLAQNLTASIFYSNDSRHQLHLQVFFEWLRHLNWTHSVIPLVFTTPSLSFFCVICQPLEARFKK